VYPAAHLHIDTDEDQLLTPVPMFSLKVLQRRGGHCSSMLRGIDLSIASQTLVPCPTRI
jgi:hypothetical protein